MSNGLCDFQAAFKLGDQLDELHEARAARHAHRRVMRLELTDADGREASAYIKRQWRRERMFPRLTEIRHRIAIKATPIHEYHGLHILQSIGLHVSEPLAVFWEGWGFSRAAVVTRAVPPAVSIADMLVSGEFQQMEPKRRANLIAAATAVALRLDQRRIAWRSMKAKHFYPEELAGGQWRIWLIDCEGVSRFANLRDRRLQWAKFLEYFQKHAPGVDQELAAQFRRAA